VNVELKSIICGDYLDIEAELCICSEWFKAHLSARGVTGRHCTSAHGLEAREATHTGAKPHVCDICGEGFSDRSNMRQHVARKHWPTGV